MGNLNLDLSSVPQSTAFDPLPPGYYTMTITRAELTMSKSPDAGEMLNLTFEVDGNAHPEHASRLAFHTLCLNHRNDKPRNIAMSNLSAIAHACLPTPHVTDTSDLLGKTLRVKLSVKPAADGYDAKNECKDFKPIGDKSAPTSASPTAKPAPAQALPATAANAKQPWKR